MFFLWSYAGVGRVSKEDLGVRDTMRCLSPSFAQNMLLAWHLKDLVKAGIQGRFCSSSRAFLSCSCPMRWVQQPVVINLASPSPVIFSPVFPCNPLLWISFCCLVAGRQRAPPSCQPLLPSIPVTSFPFSSSLLPAAAGGTCQGSSSRLRLDFRVWDSLLAMRCSNLAGLVGYGRTELAVFRTMKLFLGKLCQSLRCCFYRCCLGFGG